jgi:hypothetical protein
MCININSFHFISKITQNNYKQGFSLVELIVYAGLASVVGLFMWSIMSALITKEHNIKELQNIVLEKNISLQRVLKLLAKSEASPTVYVPGNAVSFTSGGVTFDNSNGRCIDFNEVVNESFFPQSLWLAYNDANGVHGIYHGENISCDENNPANMVRFSDLIYVKADTTRPWFVTDNATVQFNFKPRGNLIGLGSNNANLDLNVNASQTVIKYNKVQEIGCRIASPNRSWFSNLPTDYRYGFVIFASNYNDAQDRLSLTNVDCSGDNSTVIDGVSVNCLFCDDDSTGNKCPVTTHNIGADDNVSGFLHLDAGATRTGNQWKNILNEVEYVPQCNTGDGCTPPITINPNSEIDSKRLITILMSNNTNILQHDQNLGTNQGSFILNLHRLSQSCTNENF